MKFLYILPFVTALVAASPGNYGYGYGSVCNNKDVLNVIQNLRDYSGQKFCKDWLKTTQKITTTSCLTKTVTTGVAQLVTVTTTTTQGVTSTKTETPEAIVELFTVTEPTSTSTTKTETVTSTSTKFRVINKRQLDATPIATLENPPAFPVPSAVQNSVISAAIAEKSGSVIEKRDQTIPRPKALKNTPAQRITDACKCFGYDPVTIKTTITIKTTSTKKVAPPKKTTTVEARSFSTSFTTLVLKSETSSTTKTEIPTVVITETATATETTTVNGNLCDEAGYVTSGNGQGNRIDFISNSPNAKSCCEACNTTPNCIASAQVGTSCQLLMRNTAVAGSVDNDMCPLGAQDYPFGSNRGGIVFPGPCGF